MLVSAYCAYASDSRDARKGGNGAAEEGVSINDAGGPQADFDESQDSRENGGIDFGPFFLSDTDLAGNKRLRWVGPLIERRESPDGQVFWAVRPFYSMAEETLPDAVDEHVVWPVWTRRATGPEEQWCLAGVVHWHDWDAEADQSRHALWVLPVYFQGRDSHGAPYTAVFPLGGSIHDFLGQDEISFVLFPFYAYLRINDVETRGYPWPLVSRTKGGKIERFIVFPFYGRSKKGTEFDKYFVMWPFWSHAHFGFEQDTGDAYIAFPLYGHAKLSSQESFFFLPPFFRFTKAKNINVTYCPWPLYQRTTGLEDKLYIWPLWGRKKCVDRRSFFFLWPLFFGERRMEQTDVEIRRFLFIPIISHEARFRKPPADEGESRLLSRGLKIWPLFSFSREDENTLFRAPSLWPFRDYKAIERNYAPFWTLYSRSRRGSVIDDELLWGFFRHRRTESGGMDLSLFPLFWVGCEEKGEGRSWSFLKGLVGYEREGDDRSLRLLYLFKFGILHRE